MTPGIQPHSVSRNTIITEPQPRSTTANGGKITANKTCKQFISDTWSSLFIKDLYPAEGGDKEGGEHEDGHLSVEVIAVVRPDEP